MFVSNYLFDLFRLVSSLTEYSLESTYLTRHLTNNFFLNYFYTHLIQIASFIVAFPMVYMYKLKTKMSIEKLKILFFV